jgi:hypothetical protein
MHRRCVGGRIPVTLINVCLHIRFGTKNFDHRQFSQLCDQYVGGLNVNTHISAYHSNLFAFDHAVLFSSYCLDENIPHMFNIWEELFCRYVTYIVAGHILIYSRMHVFT